MANEWDEFSKSIKLLDKKPVHKQVKTQPKPLVATHAPIPVFTTSIKKLKDLEVGNRSDIDKNLVNKMDSGEISIEAKIDFHGMRLEDAFREFLQFIIKARADSKRMLLVITGKGSRSEPGAPTINLEIRKWANHTIVRQHILRINFAHQRHGGQGAFYILLRRER